MKIKERRGRYNLNVTRYEALLIKDALYDFQENRSETQEWDSHNDPIVVSQMIKKTDGIE